MSGFYGQCGRCGCEAKVPATDDGHELGEYQKDSSSGVEIICRRCARELGLTVITRGELRRRFDLAMAVYINTGGGSVAHRNAAHHQCCEIGGFLQGHNGEADSPEAAEAEFEHAKPVYFTGDHRRLLRNEQDWR